MGARSFPLRVKAPGRLVAVKGAGRRERAGGQQGGGGRRPGASFPSTRSPLLARGTRSRAAPVARGAALGHRDGAGATTPHPARLRAPGARSPGEAVPGSPRSLNPGGAAGRRAGEEGRLRDAAGLAHGPCLTFQLPTSSRCGPVPGPCGSWGQASSGAWGPVPRLGLGQPGPGWSCTDAG